MKALKQIAWVNEENMLIILEEFNENFALSSSSFSLKIVLRKVFIHAENLQKLLKSFEGAQIYLICCFEREI